VIRNRDSRDAAANWRAWILALHSIRTQAEPRLTREQIREACGYQISIKTISRHLAWLRDHGELPR
jgi:hypothetical protein